MSAHRHIDVRALKAVGSDLHRPESVVATRTGAVFVPDWRGGVTRIEADGGQRTWLAAGSATELRPNGIAVTSDGSFLLANLGEAGGVWRLRRDGSLSPFVTEVDGVRLPPANFVTEDAHGRSWISVSTRRVPRQQAWRADVADGFILLADRRGARIVADGLHYTNEVRPDPSGRWLYAVETFGRRLSRFPIGADGSLGRRETVIDFGFGSFPDGFAFDEDGGIWVTSLVSNRLLRLEGDSLQVVLEDCNPGRVDDVEAAFAAGTMKAEHLGPIPGTSVQQLTSIGFGGRDGRTVYLGSLHAQSLWCFRADVSGAPEAHWGFGDL